MSAKFSDIIEYFELLAIQHIEIGHSYNEKHFYRLELEEVFTGLKNINYPALILEGYRCAWVDNKSDNVLKTRTGAFMLISHLSDPGDYDAMHEIWDRMEEICDDILARIRSDKRNPSAKAVRNFDMGSIEMALISNAQDHNYGIRCTYSIQSPAAVELDPDKWNLE